VLVHIARANKATLEATATELLISSYFLAKIPRRSNFIPSVLSNQDFGEFTIIFDKL
jgi:hypothetical protein